MSGQTEYGKGSTYRPIDRKKYDSNWDNAFGKDNGVTYYSKREKKMVTIPKVKKG